MKIIKTKLKNFDIYKYFDEQICKYDQDNYYEACIDILKEYYIKKYYKLLNYDDNINDIEFDYTYKDAERIYQLFKKEFDSFDIEEDVKPKTRYVFIKYSLVLLLVYGFHKYPLLFC